MKPLRMMLTTFILIQLNSIDVEAQYVLVNQAGYLPDHVNYAYFISPDDSFYVIEKTSGIVQFAGALEQTSLKDPACGLMTFRGDFSSLSREGTYQISTTSSDTSFTFSISNHGFEVVYKKSLKGFYFQRCGMPLLSQNAGVYARSTCHTHDSTFHSSTGVTGSSLTTGGWHDAGDYGKYVVNAGVSVGTLLLAYELFPSRLKYDDLNIPESGNSIPDILDEARFELEWFLKMQDTADGGVYFKVTTENFDAFEMPNQDVSTRYIYQKSSTATGDFAAVMAQAARIYSPFDTAFASQCLIASRLAWQYLKANPTIVPTGGFHNPAGTGTGEYGDGNDSDERLWAAAELFVTTGEDAFHNFFKSNYNSVGLFTSTMGWADVRAMAHTAYLIGKQSKADSAIKTQLQIALNTRCTALSGVSASDGLNVALTPADYGWGSNGYDLNNAVVLILGYTTSGNVSFYNAALEQLNYILGCNRHNMTFVTGVGSVYPMHPHHRPSASDGIVEPIPGLMAGGPDKYLDDAVLQAKFTSSSPPAYCYVDDQNSYASNEIAINWNAPLVFVSGYFNESTVTSVKEKKTEVPLGFALAQNYPNPFNPSTIISYQVPANSFVTLKLYDILGREVKTLVHQRQNAGSYTVTFFAAGLQTGVYFYRLQAGSVSQTRKMIVLK